MNGFFSSTDGNSGYDNKNRDFFEIMDIQV